MVILRTLLTFSFINFLACSFCTTGGGIACTEIGCISPCSLPPSSGPCRAAIPAFYYDQTSESCRKFTYGGCEGNANNFHSVGDCLAVCAPGIYIRTYAHTHAIIHDCVVDNRCLQPKEIGYCDAVFPSFFFNIASGECERFIYGGCGGNQNRFSLRVECLETCAPDSKCKKLQLCVPDHDMHI